jgi:hypothetical protein
MHVLTLPPGTAARLHTLPEVGDFPSAVVLAGQEGNAPPECFYDAMGGSAGASVILTHAKGVRWTDRTGEVLLMATLGLGGIALMAFEALPVRDGVGHRPARRRHAPRRPFDNG